MRIVHIDQMLEVCQEHLETSRSFGTEIEILLTYALLVRIYAEFEQEVQAAIAEKGESITDSALRGVFDALIKDKFRGIRFSYLSELFGACGEQCKADWDAKRRGNQRAVTFYGSIETQRNATAHRDGAAATFQNVRDWYEEGHIVLDFFRETLMSIDPERLPTNRRRPRIAVAAISILSTFIPSTRRRRR